MGLLIGVIPRFRLALPRNLMTTASYTISRDVI